MVISLTFLQRWRIQLHSKEVVDLDSNIQGTSEGFKDTPWDIYKIASTRARSDIRGWPLDNSGNFTLKSYYKLIRPRGHTVWFSRKYGHNIFLLEFPPPYGECFIVSCQRQTTLQYFLHLDVIVVPGAQGKPLSICFYIVISKVCLAVF